MGKNILKGSLVLSALLLFTPYAFANDELKSFAKIKYKTEYSSLNDEQKKKLSSEYENLKKLSTKLQENEMKNNSDLKIATSISTIQIWSNEFLKNYKPTDAELKALFESQKPIVNAKYTLRNILVNDEATADKLVKSLAIKDKQKQKDAFIKAVKQESKDSITLKNDGLIKELSANKLNPDVKKALEGKKIQDIVKVNLKNQGWQILLIEDFKPQKNATFEESKELLTKLAKKQALNKEIKKITEK